jgi:hypothetical protein
MDGEGSTNEIEAHTNGAIPPPSIAEAGKKAGKPWIEAGFKSRDAWRKSKGHKTAKKKKPAKAAKKAKPVKKVAAPKKKAKPVKAKKKAAKKVAKSKARHDVPKKSIKEQLQAHARTKHFMRVTGKRKDGNPKELKVFAAFGGKGKEKTIEELRLKAFASVKPAAKGRSWVRNALRWNRATKRVKLLGSGKYKRIA